MLPPERAETPPPPQRARARSWLAGGALDEEQARRYRQRVFQMGLLVCLLLLFVDQRNGGGGGGGASSYGDNTGNSAGTAASGSGGGVANASQDDSGLQDYGAGAGGIVIPEGRMQRVSEFLRLQHGDGDFYATNATGYYRGAWAMPVEAPKEVDAHPGRRRRQAQLKGLDGTTSSSNSSSSIANESAIIPTATAAAAGAPGPAAGVTLHHSEGRFDMQLYMNPLPGVTDLSIVYGYFKLLDGPYSTELDIYAVAKGVYLHRDGRLLLRTMTQKDAGSIAFTFTLPAASAANLDTNATTVPVPPAKGGGDQLLQEDNKEEEEEQEKQAAEPSGEWNDEDALPPVRRRNRRRRIQALPTPPAVEPHDLGRRVAALWHDAKGQPDPERRLQAVLDEVVPVSTEDKAAAAAAAVAAAAAKEDDEVVKVLGLTVLDEAATAAGGAEQVAADGSLVESVIIPNRSKNQYIRETTTNGRRCVFTLDAHTLPRLNTSQVMGQTEEGEASSSSSAAAADSEERLKWVEGLEGMLTSPECNIALNVSSEAIRLDWSQAYRKAVNYSIVVTLVCVLQIALLFWQLYYSRTQAAASRVSLLSIGQQAILDALLCIAHLLLCAMLQPLFAAFASIAFFKLVIFSIFEIRYMFIIHQSRNSQSANAASFNGLRRQLATLHARFYAILFFLLFLIYFLANYLEVIIFLLYSFWVPQIVMNARKGVRQPLNRTYVVGMSLARLMIPLYVYGCPQNFVHLLFSEYEPDYQMCAALVVWVGLQVALLLSQDYLGPQFFVPARYLPPKYDYYRPLPQRRGQGGGSDASSPGGTDIEMTGLEEGRGGGEGSGRDGQQEEEEEGGTYECVICYNDIDVDHVGSFMVAPCNHCYHSDCLERWMEIKLECPVCRAPLPHQ